MEPDRTASSEEAERRQFLTKCGRFAAITPPAIALLLSTSLTSNAIAASGGGRSIGSSGQVGRGLGAGGGNGPPGNVPLGNGPNGNGPPGNAPGNGRGSGNNGRGPGNAGGGR